MLSVNSHRYIWKRCSKALGCSVWMCSVSIEPLWGSGCAKLPLQLQLGLPQVLPTPQLPVLSSTFCVHCCMAFAQVVWTGIFRTTFLAWSSSDSSLCATASCLEATGEAGCWEMGSVAGRLKHLQVFLCSLPRKDLLYIYRRKTAVSGTPPAPILVDITTD